MSFLGLAAFLLYALYHVARFMPRPVRNGEFKLVDHHDGPLTVVVHAVAALIATGVAIAFLVVAHDGLNVQDRLLMGVADLLAWGVVIWVCWAGLRDFRAGEPGELRLPCHPLPAGREVTVRYSRRLKRADTLEAVCAELVLYHNERRNGNTYRERCDAIHLGDGGARLHKGAIKATWSFRVPDPTGGEASWLPRPFAFLVQVANAYEWVLEVKTPLGQHHGADSCFTLPVVAGDAQVEEAPGPVRRAG